MWLNNITRKGNDFLIVFFKINSKVCGYLYYSGTCVYAKHHNNLLGLHVCTVIPGHTVTFTHNESVFRVWQYDNLFVQQLKCAHW